MKLRNMADHGCLAQQAALTSSASLFFGCSSFRFVLQSMSILLMVLTSRNFEPAKQLTFPEQEPAALVSGTIGAGACHWLQNTLNNRYIGRTPVDSWPSQGTTRKNWMKAKILANGCQATRRIPLVKQPSPKPSSSKCGPRIGDHLWSELRPRLPAKGHGLDTDLS